MRKLLNNPWFVTAMALLAIALAWSPMRPTDSVSGQTAANFHEPADTAADQPLPGGALGTVSPGEVLKQLPAPKPTRDPFASRNNQAAVATETVELPDLVDTARLTGVWTQNGATLLLVNERVAKVGDIVGRFTIESASQDGIWLSHWKGRDFLAVGQTFSLKTPARLAAQASTP